MNILIVDDEPTYRQMLETFLRMEGWSVLTASDGQDALQRLGEAKVDCIISDVYMPVMDGLKFHTKLREMPEYKTIPFLFVSAYSDLYTLNAVTSTNNDGFLQKTKPLKLLKEWILYLMTPEDKRPSGHPEETTTQTKYERSHDRSIPRRK